MFFMLFTYSQKSSCGENMSSPPFAAFAMLIVFTILYEKLFHVNIKISAAYSADALCFIFFQIFLNGTSKIIRLTTTAIAKHIPATIKPSL